MSNKKLFVGSLPPTIDEETFVHVFAPYGTVVSSVCSPAKKYGFVTFSTPAEAQAAIQGTNGLNILGSNIVVKLADNQSIPTGAPPTQPPGDRIYVKGLPAGLTDETLLSLFADYGAVVDCKVLVNDGLSDDGTGQSVGIVRFSSSNEAAWLVENLNGNMVQGLTRPVEVSFAGAPRSRAEVQSNHRYSPYEAYAPYEAVKTELRQPIPVQPVQPIQPHLSLQPAVPNPAVLSEALIPGLPQMLAQCGLSSKLYVKGLPLHADDLYLYKVFAPFGCILSVKAIRKDHFVIGFVTYSSDIEAQGAIESINGQPLLDGSVLQVSVKTSKT
jgi:RNA recognition motif-containing protein